MSFVFPGINKTFEEFVYDLLNIEFGEFDKVSKTDQEKRLKGKVFEYFLYELASHNGMIVEMNQTFISFSKNIFKKLSDGCTDLHDFIPKVHEYENTFKNNKIELEKEKTKCLEYEIENRILKTYNEKLEQNIKELKEKLDDIKNQNNLILEILNKK
ncbi:1560_t:CDS:2 [Cetraspora pellucida]|uniref:1560_t:CDS:1 n=1 Tax=Cetraspora pellucida TaxID=1433469 RepID=A0ACA9Q682_9GLOM|nr:1560_t:CDS:2 [Cetraspora pellucida]